MPWLPACLVIAIGVEAIVGAVAGVKAITPRIRGPLGVKILGGLAAGAAYAGFKQPNWFPFFKRPDPLIPRSLTLFII